MLLFLVSHCTKRRDRLRLRPQRAASVALPCLHVSANADVDDDEPDRGRPGEKAIHEDLCQVNLTEGVRGEVGLTGISVRSPLGKVLTKSSLRGAFLSKTGVLLEGVLLVG